MQVVLADVAAQIGDFLEAGDVASGVVLDLLDRLGRVQQIIGRARVKPGKITIQLDDMKLVAAQVLTSVISSSPRAEGSRPRAMSMTWLS